MNTTDPIDDTENLYPPAGHPDAVPCTPEETAAYEARVAKHTLARIRFTAGTTGEGYQETTADGNLVRLYTATGDQFDPGNAEWDHVRDVGEIDPDDSDTFWDALERDGADISV